MDNFALNSNGLTGKHFCALKLRDGYTSLPSCFVRKNALVSTRTACMCVSRELTMRHALRLRSRCTGQDAFKTFMKQTLPACYVSL